MARDQGETETAAAGGGNALAVRRFSLRRLPAPDPAARFLSGGPRTVIGSHPNADLVIDDATVSRFHCELEVSGASVVVRDLASKNGTRVNGLRVATAFLEGPATLSLGHSDLAFEPGESYIEVPLSASERFGELIGGSPAMRAAFAQLEKGADSDLTILLTGETGTGKELAARGIHERSGRRRAPFVVIDCGAIPRGLIESELFGHERGAFTGADQLRKGAFERAAGGTVFLDEIGELDLDLQPKLLRVLERREVTRVGGAHPIPLDVRVVAATNRNLYASVNSGRFRGDLFYRLSVLEVRMPALRERVEDVPMLVGHFVAAMQAEAIEEAAPLADQAFLADLMRHGWRGNVRELRNFVQRFLAGQRPERAIGGWEAPPAIDVDQPLASVRQTWIRYAERRYVIELLERHGQNVTTAARAAGVNRTHLYRIMAACGLR
jgi:two-component system, NtrC family, response regulator GlrR